MNYKDLSYDELKKLSWEKLYEIHSIKLLPLILIGTVCLSWLIAYTSSKLPLIKEVSGVK